jgi:hypothetical protein
VNVGKLDALRKIDDALAGRGRGDLADVDRQRGRGIGAARERARVIL